MKLKILFLIALGSFLLCGMFSTPHNAQASSKPALSLARQGQRPPNDTITPPPPPSPDPGPLTRVELQCGGSYSVACKAQCTKCLAVYSAFIGVGGCTGCRGVCSCGGIFFNMNPRF